MPVILVIIAPTIRLGAHPADKLIDHLATTRSPRAS